VRFSTVLVGLFLLSGLALGFTGFLSDLARTYHPNIDAGALNNSFDSVTALTNTSTELQDDVFSAEPTEQNVFQLVATGSVKAVRGMFASFGIITSIFSAAAVNTLGIVPDWAWSIALGIIGMLLLIALVFFFAGKDP